MVNNPDKKRLLVVIRHSPYSTSLAKASLDVVFAAAAFEQDIEILFLGEGVLQLLPEQDSSGLGRKNVGRQLASLPLYDINSVYVDTDAISRYNIDLTTLSVDSTPVNAEAMRQLMETSHHLLGF